jgi:hypothetical protein
MGGFDFGEISVMRGKPLREPSVVRGQAGVVRRETARMGAVARGSDVGGVGVVSMARLGRVVTIRRMVMSMARLGIVGIVLTVDTPKSTLVDGLFLGQHSAQASAVLVMLQRKTLVGRQMAHLLEMATPGRLLFQGELMQVRLVARAALIVRAGVMVMVVVLGPGNRAGSTTERKKT